LERQDWQVTTVKLQEVNGDLIEVHTSGHIYAEDILSLVNDLGAKSVVPIHTFEGGRFLDHFENVRLLADGETLQV
jgi:ribonuclease J